MSPVSSFAFDLPNANARFPPACSWRSRKNQSPNITIQGSRLMSTALKPALGSRAVIGTPASSTRFMNCSLFAIGSSTVKLLALRPSCVTGALEVALDTLAVEDLDTRDVAPLELMAELAVGKFRRRAALAAHHLEERERQQPHEQPERQVLAHVPPTRPGGTRHAFSHLFLSGPPVTGDDNARPYRAVITVM